MPIAAEKLETLKADIAVARRRPLAFGLCIGKSAETTVLLTHKAKEPEALGRLAKKEGETSKLAFGQMSVEGKNLNLNCQGDVPAGLARKTKEMLKAAGLKLKVRILDAEGNVFEEDGDDEEEGEEAKEGRAEVAASEGPGEAAGEEADSGKEEWETVAAKLRPRIEAMAGARTPEAKKLLAYWSFALSKAEADKPDHAAALKTAAMLTKLLGAAAPEATASEVDPKAAARARRNRSREMDELETELRLLNRAFA